METSEQAIQAQHYETIRDQAQAQAKQPDRPYELHQAYGPLDDEVASLRDMVSELERRLSPYLRQDPVASQPPSGGVADTGYTSELAQRVERTAEAVRASRTNLSHLLNRLEI